MPAGQTPHTTIVYSHNDLVDKVQPGDRVNITGEAKTCSELFSPRKKQRVVHRFTL